MTSDDLVVDETVEPDSPVRAPWKKPAGLWVWRCVFATVTLAPLGLSLIQLDPGRGFWVNLSAAVGFVTLSLLGLQFVLAARIARTTAPFGTDVLLQFHRQITALIFLLALGHPLVLFAWDSRFLSLLDVIDAPWRAKLAVTADVALIVLVITSIWRTRLRLRYPVWQLLHATLALVIAVTALAHVVMIGYYVDQPWEKGLWIAYTAAFVWIGIWVRVIKPIQRWRRRLVVLSVTEEGGHSHAVELMPVQPARFGPRGLAFAPGQFAWIMVGRSPFALTYHPFSYASSAVEPDRVTFIIRSYGPFTAALHDLTPGTSVYLDGPWGHFSPDRIDARGWVLIAGGVGITPMLSILLTRRDRGDTRPVWLFHAATDAASLIGRELLEALDDDPNVTIVTILSRAGEEWAGPRGRISADLLRSFLPRDLSGMHCYICGPEPMMDAAGAAALNAGLTPDSVHAERFAMA